MIVKSRQLFTAQIGRVGKFRAWGKSKDCEGEAEEKTTISVFLGNGFAASELTSVVPLCDVRPQQCVSSEAVLRWQSPLGDQCQDPRGLIVGTDWPQLSGGEPRQHAVTLGEANQSIFIVKIWRALHSNTAILRLREEAAPAHRTMTGMTPCSTTSTFRGPPARRPATWSAPSSSARRWDTTWSR